MFMETRLFSGPSFERNLWLDFFFFFFFIFYVIIQSLVKKPESEGDLESEGGLISKQVFEISRNGGRSLPFH